MISYKPIGNRVLLKMDPPDKQVGGIYVPDADIVIPIIGTVIALGTGKVVDGKQIPWKVKVGDRVVVENTMDSITLDMNDEKIMIYRQDEIVGLVTA